MWWNLAEYKFYLPVHISQSLLMFQLNEHLADQMWNTLIGSYNVCFVVMENLDWSFLTLYAVMYYIINVLYLDV